MLRVAWSKVYNHQLPEGHRFPMLKYDLIREQLLIEESLKGENFFEPPYINEDLITQAHSPDYWQRLKGLALSPSEIRRTGFPLTKELVEREAIITNGTVLACDFALKNKVAFNIAGGTHHAYSDKGEGFCLLNDNAIAAKYLILSGKVKKVLIVDLDVHQGNGTARIFQDDPAVFTFSMHAKSNIFSQKENSDLDIDLPDNIEDEEYLSILNEALLPVIDEFQPEFALYQSGVDVLKSDKLGKLSLSKEGCMLRDKFVLTLCKQNNIPIAIDMGGGYSPKLSDIVDAHCNTFRSALDIFF